MAKPNYSFEKRQRELAKKRKKEEKAAKKANPQPGGAPDADDGLAAAPEGTSTDAPAGDAPPPAA